MTVVKKISAFVAVFAMVIGLSTLTLWSVYENTMQRASTAGNMSSQMSPSVSHKLRHAATKSRESAVRIVSMSPDGAGLSSMSGTYIRALNRHYVLTVMHGIAGPCEFTKVIVGENYYDCIKYIHGDTSYDYMIMEIEKIHDRRALNLFTDVALWERIEPLPKVLEPVYYTGYPNTMGPFTVGGSVMGYDAPDGRNFYIFSYAWMGASGSGVINADGKLIGYVIAIDVGITDFGAQVLEDVVMVGPATYVDWKPVLKEFYN